MKDEKKSSDIRAANLGGGKQNPQQPGQPQGGQQQKQPQQNWQRPGENRGGQGQSTGGNMGNINKNKDQDRNKF